MWLGRVFAREVLQPEKGGFYVGARTDCGGYYEVILEIAVYLALARGHPDVCVVARHGNAELRQVLDACPGGCLGCHLFRFVAANSVGEDPPALRDEGTVCPALSNHTMRGYQRVDNVRFVVEVIDLGIVASERSRLINALVRWHLGSRSLVEDNCMDGDALLNY